MGLRLFTNVRPFALQGSGATRRPAPALPRDSSGLRIADVGGTSHVSCKLETPEKPAALEPKEAATKNAGEGLGLVRIAEAALCEVGDLLARMRELLMQAGNTAITAEDRVDLGTEYHALAEEIDHIAQSTAFGGVFLLNGAGAGIEIQVEIDGTSDMITVSGADVSVATLGVDVNVDTATSAGTAMGNVDKALGVVQGAKAHLGAQRQRLNTALSALDR